MGSTAGAAESNPDAQAKTAAAKRLGIGSGDVVLEMGYGDDCDEKLRAAAVAVSGTDLVGEDSDEVVDVTLLWFREDDGDLVDTLVDALGPLAEDGQIWLLTPKVGRDGHVEPGEVSESVRTAGLQQTTSISASTDWAGTRLVVPKSDRVRR